jgi:hypothetical protein
MPKTIAIAGFSTITLAALKESKADEIWTLNHAFAMEFAFPRMDRVFEIHKPNWFLRDGQFYLERYARWLQEPHPFPIYMQEVDPQFPASVRYPFEAVCENIFGKLLRNGEKNLYFSSSFGYMMGLAILERIPRVEIYGIDASNDTEWYYQKPGIELMIGVAIGRGIEVILHPVTHLCRAQLYGYDRVPAASRERVEALIAIYQKEYDRYEMEANAFATAYNLGESKDTSAYMEAGAWEAMYDGALHRLKKFLEVHEVFFGRQQLENARHVERMKEEQYLAETNEKKAIVQYLQTRGSSDMEKVWQEYMEARYNLYYYSGARMAVQKLIDECDMKVVPELLVREITDGG